MALELASAWKVRKKKHAKGELTQPKFRREKKATYEMLNKTNLKLKKIYS